MPRFFIISGCNGAGKTTASYTLLPQLLNLHTFVNADEIADELSPQDPERESLRAFRLMLERMDQLIARGEDFAVETTLATKSLAGIIENAQQLGYKVGLLYFWLKSPELAVKRVAIRVASGGHNIPENTIVRRYWQGMQNLRNIYLPRCDSWVLIDNSATDANWIAERKTGEETPVIYNKRLYNLILNPENPI
ncbi:MAG: zeta toxin family protein [Bacteroidales bacterium]|nr:zeta toxin family protein [Bacteroidales bacterium]